MTNTVESVPEVVSEWARYAQRKSAEARWRKLTKSQRSEIMRKVRAGRADKRKAKRENPVNQT